MAKDRQADTSSHVPTLDIDSVYRNIQANDNSRLHNGHVFNTIHHSMLLPQSHLLYFSHKIDADDQITALHHTPMTDLYRK